MERAPCWGAPPPVAGVCPLLSAPRLRLARTRTDHLGSLSDVTRDSGARNHEAGALYHWVGPDVREHASSSTGAQVRPAHSSIDQRTCLDSRRSAVGLAVIRIARRGETGAIGGYFASAA
jgi:hypothetical protein